MTNEQIPLETVLAEAARNEAERFRQLAEKTREIRDEEREALEVVRRGRNGNLREIRDTNKLESH